MNFLLRLFDSAGFPARWNCGPGWAEEPWLGWLHILSDLGVWGAYVAIPLVLGYFSWRKRDLPFRTVFLLFGAFILACGTTHLMEAIIFYWPAYRLAGVIKLFTAVVSWATVVSLFGVVPTALAMRSPDELEREIKARRAAEKALQTANSELERRVSERTAELAAQGEQLRVTVAALQKSELALKEADRNKDEFLATLAHELRNPLAPIRNSLEVIKRTQEPAVLHSSAAVMDRQMSQMVRLIDDLIDISRITHNRVELRRDSVVLQGIVAQAVEVSRPALDAYNHQLSLNLPAEPIYLNADAVRLVQVFGNLLTNSSKYTSPGGQIEVAAEVLGAEVAVHVRDNGIGIARDQLSKVFEMFTQLDRSPERSQGGLGIGLAIVQRLVHLHGGSVSVRSDGPGKGTEFTIRLPAASAPPVPTRTEAPATAKPLARRRILVVDDNRDSAASLAILLRLAGNELQTAHDGREAVDKAGEFQPQVVLLDLGMPVMNGYDACRAIREQSWGKGMHIIALTGWGQENDRKKSREAGFDAHLVKPVDHAVLLNLLRGLPVSTN